MAVYWLSSVVCIISDRSHGLFLPPLPPLQCVTGSQTSRWPISSAAEASATLTCDTANRWPRKAASSSSPRCPWACSSSWSRRNCCRRSVRKRTIRGQSKRYYSRPQGGSRELLAPPRRDEGRRSQNVKKKIHLLVLWRQYCKNLFVICTCLTVIYFLNFLICFCVFCIMIIFCCL